MISIHTQIFMQHIGLDFLLLDQLIRASSNNLVVIYKVLEHI